MKILHTADIHLREYADERWMALQELVDLAGKEGIDIFVISGDLFDEGINAENLRPYLRKIFSGNSFKIIILPGNHDKDSFGGGMYFGDDTVILNNLHTPFENEKVRIWGMSFEHAGEAEIQARLRMLKDRLSPDKSNILVYHGELLDAFYFRGELGDEGTGRYMPFKLSYFKDLPFHYILAGHFHRNFDVRLLDNGGYFIYPGSPVSVTRRETGLRKVNIFRLGSPPEERTLNTSHFAEVVIELEPFKHQNPLEIIEKHLMSLHSQARVVLTVKGYINSAELGVSETELVAGIKKKIGGINCVEENYEFRDISIILENSLFKKFSSVLGQADHPEVTKRQILALAIQAMMGVRK
ncbi:MAG: DNA repair exonuclease [Dethiobacter sp.]|jgi:DNA repair exonuclease SbcCD nuclease subunit|nr:MAG: DNA repair exonuclease [Dethiobacter sp.]